MVQQKNRNKNRVLKKRFVLKKYDGKNKKQEN